MFSSYHFTTLSYLVIGCLLQLYCSSVYMNLCTLHIGLNAVCNFERKIRKRRCAQVNILTKHKTQVSFFQLTDHLSLVMDHHSQILKNLVYIYYVSLVRAEETKLTMHMRQRSRGWTSCGSGWYLQLSDVGFSLLDDFKVLLCDGRLFSLGLALTPFTFPAKPCISISLLTSQTLYMNQHQK